MLSGNQKEKEKSKVETISKMNKPKNRPLLSKWFCIVNAKKAPECPRLPMKVLALRALQPSAHPVSGKNGSCHLCGDSEHGTRICGSSNTLTVVFYGAMKVFPRQ